MRPAIAPPRALPARAVRIKARSPLHHPVLCDSPRPPFVPSRHSHIVRVQIPRTPRPSPAHSSAQHTPRAPAQATPATHPVAPLLHPPPLSPTSLSSCQNVSPNCVCRTQSSLPDRALTTPVSSEGTRWSKCGVCLATVIASRGTGQLSAPPAAFPAPSRRRDHGLQLGQVRAQLPPPARLPRPDVHKGELIVRVSGVSGARTGRARGGGSARPRPSENALFPSPPLHAGPPPRPMSSYVIIRC